MKSGRQELILKLISEQNIDTQNQLMAALESHGVKSTQATLSRDIKELRLVKELSPDGGYRYTVSHDESSDHEVRLKKIFRECVSSVDTAQNIVVVRTLPGLANAAASAMDKMSIRGLVGTIAGDDTAFLAMKNNECAERFCREIEAML